MITIHRQCELLSVSRSGFYYRPAEEGPFNLSIMRRIDEQYTRTPFYGVRRNLLRGLVIDRPNQVWSADITSIRMDCGFVYRVAIIDWFSRYVLSREIATALEKEFCMSALQKALPVATPEIFNTDQGVQFTNGDFIKILEDKKIKVSMDGKGRAFDNIFVERLWRTVKYEEVYLHSYQTVKEARLNLESYFNFYNSERFHQALNYETPEQKYFRVKTKTTQGLAAHLKQPTFLS